MRGFLIMVMIASIIAITASATMAAGDQADLLNQDWYQEERYLYDGIPLQVRFTPANQQLADEVWRYFKSIDQVFNDYREDSEIGVINAHGPGVYQLSESLAEAFAGSAHLYRLTDGAFDITVGPLRRLWREAGRSGKRPSSELLVQARAAMGSNAWKINNGSVEKIRPGVQFDFGGVIKGMSVDHALTMLITAGVRAALIQNGGETACFGLSPRGRLHVLGIPDPRKPDEDMWCSIADPGTGLSGSTSGNYRRPILVEGKTFYHIFDPRSGEPVDTHTLSVSVAFPMNGRNGLADGLTKVGAVLGWKRLFSLVESLGGEAFVLTQEGERIVEHASAHWSKFVKTQHMNEGTP